MVAISPTVVAIQEDHKYTVTWSNVTESDTCVAFSFQQYAQDINVELDGTWGAATLTILPPNTSAGVTAMDGSTASWTADAIFSVLQRPSSLTPTFTGGTSQSITIVLTVWY